MIPKFQGWLWSVNIEFFGLRNSKNLKMLSLVIIMAIQCYLKMKVMLESLHPRTTVAHELKLDFLNQALRIVHS